MYDSYDQYIDALEKEIDIEEKTASEMVEILETSYFNKTRYSDIYQEYNRN
jgi:flagellar biosynthesis chaperone FliJ